MIEGPRFGSMPYIYYDGAIRHQDTVSFSPSTQGLNYGTGVFEGIRGYWNESQREFHLLRLPEHWKRLLDSARVLRLEIPETAEELTAVVVAMIQRNGYEGDIYFRPLAHKLGFLPGAGFGVKLREISTAFSIYSLPMKSNRVAPELRCGVSSWRRVPDSSIPSRAKITGSYVNIALAVDEAQAAGFDDAILLNQAGAVAEASTANVFLVRDGEVVTPPSSSDILEGITRSCVMELAWAELGRAVSVRAVSRSELYVADEVFLTGTGCELAPVVEIDGRKVGTGDPGEIFKLLSAGYAKAVRGEDMRYGHWLTTVGSGARDTGPVEDRDEVDHGRHQ